MCVCTLEFTINANQKSGKTTTQEPGACHMGRAADKPALLDCWRVSESNTTVHMRCPGNLTLVVPKRMTKTPTEMVDDGMYKRQHCATHCDAPPKFVGGDGRDMPVAEVGYGRPFRWEMARMLAGETYQFLLFHREPVVQYQSSGPSGDAIRYA